MQSPYLLGVLFATVILIAVFLRLRNSGMKERYATWWIVIALASVIGSFFPQILHGLAHALGIQVPLNLAFFAAGVVLLLLTLRLSVDLSQASEERRKLVEEVALLDCDLRKLQERLTVLEAAKTDASRDDPSPRDV